jgi:hypothetical protein
MSQLPVKYFGLEAPVESNHSQAKIQMQAEGYFTVM